jgi:DNA-binding beta-propeller fold protein YncE
MHVLQKNLHSRSPFGNSHKFSNYFNMNFLPAIPLSAFPAEFFSGGMAVNASGSLIASVNGSLHSVSIYSVDGSGKRPADVVVVGFSHDNGGLFLPRSPCFVRRNCTDTLLVCDASNDRVLEFTARGIFLRAIAMEIGSGPCGIAERDGVIAVSLNQAHSVVLLEYESGALRSEVTIGSIGGAGKRGGDGQLSNPRGVIITADGRHVLVADCFNHRVSKFSAATGAFIAHVATLEANGLSYPRDVLQCEDGSLLVSQGLLTTDGTVVWVGEDGVTVQKLVVRSALGVVLSPLSLAYSPLLKGVVVETFKEGMFLLREDGWMASSRAAWLAALSCD